MKLLHIKLFALILIFGTSCAVSPVFTHFDTAETLGKGKVEVSGSVSAYVFNDDELEKNYNIGGRVRVGVSDRVDLGLRYEYIEKAIDWEMFNFAGGPEEYREFYSWYYLSLEYKKSLNNNWAFKMPLSVYINNGVSDFRYYSISPSFLKTYQYNPSLQGTLGINTQVVVRDDNYGENGAWPILGVSYGLNIKLADHWDLRPEVGLHTSGFQGFLNAGVAVVARID